MKLVDIKNNFLVVEIDVNRQLSLSTLESDEFLSSLLNQELKK
jgi:hypothetical protein